MSSFPDNKHILETADIVAAIGGTVLDLPDGTQAIQVQLLITDTKRYVPGQRPASFHFDSRTIPIEDPIAWLARQNAAQLPNIVRTPDVLATPATQLASPVIPEPTADTSVQEVPVIVTDLAPEAAVPAE